MKKWIAGMMIPMILLVSVAGCGNKASQVLDTTAESTADNTADTTAAPDTSTPLPELFPAPSVCPPGLAMNNVELDPALFDFWFYFFLMQNAQYLPQTEDGKPDLDAIYENDMTYRQVIFNMVLSQLQSIAIRADKAIELSLTVSEEHEAILADFYDYVKTQAETYGITEDDYLKADYGEYATMEKVKEFLHADALGGMYSSSITFEQDKMDEYYAAHKEEIGPLQFPIVHHILISADDKATEEETQAAKTLAEETLAKVDDGEDIASLGTAMQLEGIARESAQYTVQVNQMVPEFDVWCFNETRVAGDTDIVKTQYGFHVMYFIDWTETDWDLVSTPMMQEFINELFNESIKLPKYTISVPDDDIAPTPAAR